MRIRALANGNVIHADDEAAKQLIEAGIYEEVSDKESQTSEKVVSPDLAAVPKSAAPTERNTRRSRKGK